MSIYCGDFFFQHDRVGFLRDYLRVKLRQIRRLVAVFALTISQVRKGGLPPQSKSGASPPSPPERLIEVSETTWKTCHWKGVDPIRDADCRASHTYRRSLPASGGSSRSSRSVLRSAKPRRVPESVK